MNRWLAPWVAALRIARRQALRAKGRTALSAVMVGLPLMLLAAVLVLALSTMPTPATVVAHELGTSAEALLRPRECAPFAHPPNDLNASACGLPGEEAGQGPLDLPPEEAARLAHDTVPGLELSEVLVGTASLDGGGRVVDEQVRLLDTLGATADTVPLLEGRLPTSATEIALAPWALDALGVAVGDTLDVTAGGGTVTATLTGVVSGSLGAAVMPRGSLELEHATTWWYVVGSTVPWSDVVALNDAGFHVISRDVLRDPPAPHEIPYEQHFAWDTRSGDAVAQVGLVAALIILEVVLLVGPAFAVGARRQARSLALVAATGGTRKDLRRIVLANGVVVGLGSSMLAVALGVLGAAIAVRWPRYDPAMTFPNLVIPWWVVGIVAIGTLIAVLAAWFPARQASRVDVVAALAGRRSEARTRPALGIAGLVAAALGVPLAVYGGHVGSTALAGGGGVLVVLGLVAASGLLVAAVGRLARRAGVATRIALRDLARQRGRTAPAAAAVLGAIAAATAGAVYMAAEAAHHTASWQPEVDVGTVKVRLEPWSSDVLATPEKAASVSAALRAIDPAAEIATLSAAVLVDAAAPDAWWGVYPLADESFACPPHLTGSGDHAEQAEDPLCSGADRGRSWWTSSTLYPDGASGSGFLVDDGTALAIIAAHGAPEASAQLAAGRVLVRGPANVWQDGQVRLQIDGSMSGAAEVPVTVLPGALVDGPLSVLDNIVVPPALVHEIDPELEIVPHAVVAAPSSPWTLEQEAELVSALREAGLEVVVDVERAPERDTSLTVIVLVGAAGILALAATWIASGLAAVESRADLATLAAVGAAPRVRRRVAGLQSGALTATGVLPGIVGGLAVGWALVSAAAGLGTDTPDPRWQVVVPWPVLGVALLGLPLLAGAMTALFTPARLPLVRRALE